ncbi:MAG: hypothetical protein H6Q68_638 [Firmicutes bacterium]|nr:hypothetical protein [Bacillota bacterium]
MKHLILQQFWDSIPQEKIKHVRRKLPYYMKKLTEERGNISNMPKGFYARRIRGTTDKYKFRVANDDRILFIYADDIKGIRMENKCGIVLLAYCSHDEQIRKGRNIEFTGNEDFSEYDFDIQSYTEETETIGFREIEASYRTLNLIIDNTRSYQVDDNDLARMAEYGVKDWQYYLNNEQYDCVQIHDRPVFLSGGAGTGKSTIGLHKLFALSKNKNARLAYFTYTKTLKEDFAKMYNSYQQDYSKSNPDELAASVEFHSLNEFCFTTLGRKSGSLIDFRKFESGFCTDNWFLFQNVPIHKVDIWQEIRGLIKGYMGRYWLRNEGLKKHQFDSPLILQEIYMSLADEDCIFNKEERKKIYSIAESYQSWLEKENKLDENDLARNMLIMLEKGKLKPVYDYIMVDEVQDLSELQIYLLLSLKRNKANFNDYFFSGDIHQMINPTYFSFSRLRMPFHYQQVDKELQLLEKNYRSQEHIVRLSNKMGELCKTYIGAKDNLSAIPLQRPGNLPFWLMPNAENRQQLFSILQRSDRKYAIIVVPNEAEKQRIKEETGTAERIFTVQEIKGLEYDYVVCVNMLTPFQSEWQDIVSGLGKKNAKYRYYFNIFYVALTRAKRNLCIYEDNIEHPLLLQIQEFMQQIALFDQSVLDLVRRANRLEVLNDARNQERLGNYDQAMQGYAESNDQIGVLRCEGKIYQKKGLYFEAVRCFLAAGENDEAWELAEELEDDKLRLFVLLQIGKSPEDLEGLFGKSLGIIHKIITSETGDPEFIELVYKNYLGPKCTEYQKKCDDCLNGIEMIKKEFALDE